MKKIAVILMVALLACGLMLSGCGGSDGPSVESVQDAGKIVMLTNAAFAPFEYMDGSDIVGVDVDIAKEIAKELGVELEIVDMNFDAIVDYVKNGKGDFAAAGMTINDERKEKVDFSIEYVTSTQYVIVMNNQDPDTFDLNDKVVGVQQGTTGDMYYASINDGTGEFIAKDVKRYKSAVDAAADMKNGRVDCVIIDELPAKKIVENNADMICFDPGWAPEDYAIAIQKGSDLIDPINSVLERLMAEGKIDEYVINHTS